MASEQAVSTIVRYLNRVKRQQLHTFIVALAGIRIFSTVISLGIFALVSIFFLFLFIIY